MFSLSTYRQLKADVSNTSDINEDFTSLGLTLNSGSRRLREELAEYSEASTEYAKEYFSTQFDIVSQQYTEKEWQEIQKSYEKGLEVEIKKYLKVDEATGLNFPSLSVHMTFQITRSYMLRYLLAYKEARKGGFTHKRALQYAQLQYRPNYTPTLISEYKNKYPDIDATCINTAISAYPTDPEGFITYCKAKIQELLQKYDDVTLVKQAVYNHIKDPEGYITRSMKLLEYFEAKYPEADLWFRRRAVLSSGTSEKYLQDSLQKVTNLVQEYPDMDIYTIKHAIITNSSPRGFLNGFQKNFEDLSKKHPSLPSRVLKRGLFSFPAQVDTFLETYKVRRKDAALRFKGVPVRTIEKALLSNKDLATYIQTFTASTAKYIEKYPELTKEFIERGVETFSIPDTFFEGVALYLRKNAEKKVAIPRWKIQAIAQQFAGKNIDTNVEKFVNEERKLKDTYPTCDSTLMNFVLYKKFLTGDAACTFIEQAQETASELSKKYPDVRLTTIKRAALSRDPEKSLKKLTEVIHDAIDSYDEDWSPGYIETVATVSNKKDIDKILEEKISTIEQLMAEFQDLGKNLITHAVVSRTDPHSWCAYSTKELHRMEREYPDADATVLKQALLQTKLENNEYVEELLSLADELFETYPEATTTVIKNGAFHFPNRAFEYVEGVLEKAEELQEQYPDVKFTRLQYLVQRHGTKKNFSEVLAQKLSKN